MTIDLESTFCETYGLAKEGPAATATPVSRAITCCWPRLELLGPAPATS